MSEFIPIDKTHLSHNEKVSISDLWILKMFTLSGICNPRFKSKALAQGAAKMLSPGFNTAIAVMNF